MTANQREQLLFERFFGFGYDEPYRFYQACTHGVVGESCTQFLPCLKVVQITSAATPGAVDAVVNKHRGDCNVVFFMTGERGFKVVTNDAYTRAQATGRAVGTAGRCIDAAPIALLLLCAKAAIVAGGGWCWCWAIGDKTRASSQSCRLICLERGGIAR